MHFYLRLRQAITSPIVSLSISYLFLVLACVTLYFLGFFVEASFLTWGPPITIAGTQVTSYSTYYTLLFIYMMNEIFISWISATVYPYLLNEVQNKKVHQTRYGLWPTLIMGWLFNIYSELDMVLIVIGTTSQIAFPLAILVGSLLVQTITTVSYMSEKGETDLVINEI